MRPTNEQLQQWLYDAEDEATTNWDIECFPKYFDPEYQSTLADLFRELLELRKAIEIYKRHRPGGGVWFTSDLHLGHAFVAGLRGFSDPAAHNVELAARWDASVRDDDLVWVLGDVTGTSAAIPAALQWVRERPGIKHLVAGNHDACHPLHSGAHKAQSEYLGAFASVEQSAVRKIYGQRVLLSHFPYSGDPDGDHTPEIRHTQWRLPDHGAWLLHGHTHSDVSLRDRQIHVGVDAHGLRPVPLRWIETAIKQAQ